MPQDLKLNLRLTADAKGFVGEVRVSKKELDKLTGSTRKGTAANRNYTRATRQTEVATRKVGKSFLAAHSQHLKYLSGFVGVAAVRGLLRTISTFEDLRAQLRAITGDAAFAAAEFERVQRFAAATPFSVLELVRGYAQLSAVSVEASDRVLTGLGNIAAVFGNFEGLIGGVLTREAETFKQFGIKVKQNGDQLVVSYKTFSKTVENSSPGLVSALVDIAEKFFPTAMDERANTLGGAFSNLGDSIDTLSDQFGQGGFAQAVTDLSRSLSEAGGGAINLSSNLGFLAGGVVRLGGLLLPLGVAYLVLGANTKLVNVATRAYNRTTGTASGRSALLTKRLYTVARSGRVAQAAMIGLKRSMVFFGGVPGLLLLAAEAAFFFSSSTRDAKDSLSGLPEDVAAFRIELEKLNAVQLAGRRVDFVDKLNAAQDEFEEAQTKLKNLKLDIGFNQSLSEEFAGRFDEKAAADRLALAAAAVEDAKQQVALRQQRVEILDTAIESPTRISDALDAKPNKATSEPLDANLDKILQSLHSRERVIRDTYAAQIAAVRDGGVALTQALAEEGKTRDGLVLELHAKRDGELTALQVQQEQITARARQQAWEASGLTGVISRLEREQAVTIVGVQVRMTKELALVKQHGAQLAVQGINSVGLVAGIEAGGAAQIAQITAEATEERQRQEREAYDASVRLQANQQTLQLANLLGFHDQIIAAEYDKQGRLATLQAEQLTQAAGFNSSVEQQALAHKQQLIDVESSRVPKVASIHKKLLDFEVKTGKQKVQAGLDIAQESFGNFAAHSKKAFRLQQVAGIANATISIAQGITKALELGPILGPIGAAVVAAAGFAQIAAIRAQQPPQAFAMGGIVDSPTFFSARGVARGVAGEAGAEAIMPVMRLPSGKLGVGYAGGGGGHNITFAPVVHVEVVSNGDDAVTGADIGRGVREQLEPLFRGLLDNELRPGGMLNSAARV